jgi:hypothetical protein
MILYLYEVKLKFHNVVSKFKSQISLDINLPALCIIKNLKL